MITLILKEQSQPLPPFTWLSFGSEGRSEQTLKTDQDNGILFLCDNGENPDAIRNVVLVGYGPCPPKNSRHRLAMALRHDAEADLFLRFPHRQDLSPVKIFSISQSGDRLRPRLTSHDRQPHGKSAPIITGVAWGWIPAFAGMTGLLFAPLSRTERES